MKTVFKVLKTFIYIIAFFAAAMWITSTQWFADFMDEAMEQECRISLENQTDNELVFGIYADVKEVGWQIKTNYKCLPSERKELFVSNSGYFYYYAESEDGSWSGDDKYFRLKNGDSLGMRIRSIPIDSLVANSYTLTLTE